MVSHAFWTSTSRMALRETFFRADLVPSVATSLEGGQSRLEMVQKGDSHLPDGRYSVLA